MGLALGSYIGAIFCLIYASIYNLDFDVSVVEITLLSILLGICIELRKINEKKG